MPYPLRYTGLSLLLCAAYALMALGSLQLAIPPGFAAPVWPAAGLALAAVLSGGIRFLPAVAAGSFIANLMISQRAGGDIAQPEILQIALLIAAGAAAQAGVSALLVTRHLHMPSTLHRMGDIVSLLVWGGLAGCLVNALWGPLILLVFGLIDTHGYWLSAFTWWTGDAIGAFLCAPLILLLLHPNVSRLRKLMVAVPSVIFTLLAVLVFLNAQHSRGRDHVQAFRSTAQEIAHDVDSRLQMLRGILMANERFFSASQFVSADEFARFSQSFIERNREIRFLAWHPLVEDVQRPRFELEMRRQGMTDYTIRSLNVYGKVSIAPQHDSYAPAAYVTPPEDRSVLAGLDMLHAPDDNAASRAADLAEMTFSALNLHDEPSLMLWYPVYNGTRQPQSVQERRSNLQGFASALISLPALLQPALTRTRESGLSLQIMSQQGGAVRRLFPVNEPLTPPHSRVETEVVIPLDIAGGHLEFRFTEHNSVPLAGYGWNMWILLTGCLVISGMFGIFLLGISARLDRLHHHRLQEERQEMIHHDSGPLWVAALVVVCCLMISGLLWHELQQREQQTMRNLIEEQARLAARNITEHVESSVRSLTRMGQRWEINKRTKAEPWQQDALHYVQDHTALTTLEWIDADFFIRRVVPREGNEKVVGLNVSFEETRRQVMDEASRRGSVTLSPPLDLVQGYRAVIAYVPLYPDGEFDGFIAGIYDLHQFLGNSIPGHYDGLLEVTITDGDLPAFVLRPQEFQDVHHHFAPVTRNLEMFNRSWTMTLEPTHAFFHRYESQLPEAALAGGILFSLLLGAAIYYAVLSGRTSSMLQEKASALADSEAQFRSAMEYAPIGMALVSREGHWLRVNKAVAEMLGYTEEELQQKTFQDLTHPDDLDNDLTLVRHLLGGDIDSYQMEKRYFHRSGRVVRALLSVSLLRDATGGPRYFISQIQDITARKTAEDRLADSYHFQRLIMKHNPDLIFVKDQNFRIIEANQAFLNVYPPQQRDQIIGYTTLEAFDPKEADNFLQQDRRAFADGYAEIYETINFPDGRLRTLFTQKIRFENAAGDAFILCLSRDMTERETLIEKLTDSNEELERFAYVCSHDLQEPLRMVRSFSEKLQQQLSGKLDGDDKAQRYFRFVIEGAERAQQLIADILIYSSLDRDTQRPESVNLNEVLDNIRDVLRPQLEEHDGEITSDELPVITGNKTQLYQLLQNLINNGLKYQKPGAKAKVHVSAQDIGTHWELAVSDNGIGMEAQHLEKIFEVFARLHRREEYAGTGVGLSICRKIVQRHGGSIYVESEKDKGSVFRFTLLK
jgi:PAS domain S-box-containing protein